ncbi:MAG: acyl carrier protein [Clostridia bacterium]|nr:acyl carrier protein [Clostridia bacterium]
MLDILKRIIDEHVNVDLDSITAETKLREDLGLDSLDMASLACEVEDEFEIEIPDDAIYSVITVGDVIKFIETEQAK